ncbi:MAG: IS1182 family transposase [Armatimonadota bacterium]
MSKPYLPYQPDQILLMPPSISEWLPEGHLAYFVSDVVDGADLSAIYASYERESRGAPPFHPAMLTKIIFYGLCRGVYSSRKLSLATHEDVAFRVLAAGNHPDFRTISEFRKRHLKSLADLFVQVLRLCRKAGLVSMKHIAIDGTKLLANASKHSAMSYSRMVEKEKELQAEIEELLGKGLDTDALEDAEYGPDRSGDELPPELSTREKRLAKIREAKEALEQEARERALAKEAERARKATEQEATGKKPRGRKPKPPKTEPEGKAQRNFTDPESRIMKDSNKAFVQAYNGQAAVDAEHQIIVACDLTNQASDCPHLSGMIDKVQANTGVKPEELSADAGYFSSENIEMVEWQGIDAYIPPDRQRHGKEPAPPTCRDPEKQSAADRQRAKLLTPEGRKVYGKRKETVEPVFGQIKSARNFRRLLLRGLEKARLEWTLVCLGHNMLKLYRHGDRNLIFEA